MDVWLGRMRQTDRPRLTHLERTGQVANHRLKVVEYVRRRRGFDVTVLSEDEYLELVAKRSG